LLISPEYVEINKQLHDDKPKFGTSGYLYAEFVEQICDAVKSQDVLDYGCGKRTLEFALCRPIQNYDPAVPSCAARPRPADVVVCTDVLEHIEPECLDDVLRDLFDLTQKIILLAIHLTPAHKHLSDGRNAHLILESPKWWEDKVSRYFKVTRKYQVEDSTFIMVCVPRPPLTSGGAEGIVQFGDNLLEKPPQSGKTVEFN